MLRLGASIDLTRSTPKRHLALSVAHPLEDVDGQVLRKRVHAHDDVRVVLAHAAREAGRAREPRVQVDHRHDRWERGREVARAPEEVGPLGCQPVACVEGVP